MALRTDLMQQPQQKQKDKVGFGWGMRTMQENRQQPMLGTSIGLGSVVGQAQKQRQIQDQKYGQLTTLRNPIPPKMPNMTRMLPPVTRPVKPLVPLMFRMGGRSDLMRGFTTPKRTYHYQPGFIERTMDLRGKVPRAILESRQSAVGYRPIPTFTRKRKGRKITLIIRRKR
jgi:hypothetical protein